MPSDLAKGIIEFLQTRYSLSDNWKSAMEKRADFVPVYRKYTSGYQDVFISDDMRKALNATGIFEDLFSADYTDMVVSEMSDRLVFERVNFDPQQAQQWIDGFTMQNRIAKLQADLHYAAIRDGEAFLIIEMPQDEEAVYPMMYLNYAFDGNDGVIPIVRDGKLEAAAKVFSRGNQRYVTIYDQMEFTNYLVDDEGEIKPTGGELADGVPDDSERLQTGYIFPVVHFAHNIRGSGYSGESEIHKALPLQNVLNRIIVSMLVASEYSAFGVTFAKGVPLEQVRGNTQPGAIIAFDDTNDKERVKDADVKRLSGDPLSPYIEEIDRVVDLLADATRTPIRSRIRANASGESMKQQESGLLGKIERAQINFGEMWAAAFGIANATGQIFAPSATPELTALTLQWRNAEVRSDSTIIQQAVSAYNIIGDPRFFLNQVAPVFNLSDEEIERILEAQDERLRRQIAGIDNPFAQNIGAFTASPDGVVEEA